MMPGSMTVLLTWGIYFDWSRKSNLLSWAFTEIVTENDEKGWGKGIETRDAKNTREKYLSLLSFSAPKSPIPVIFQCP